MSRSKWKGFFQKILKINKKISFKQPVKIWSRSSVISSRFLERNVLISTGNGFKKIFITRAHIGYKFGEFSPTRSIKRKFKNK